MGTFRSYKALISGLVIAVGSSPAVASISLCDQLYAGTATPIRTCYFYNESGVLTGSFTGFARKVETVDHVKIVLRGEFTGSGTLETWTAYTLGDWIGDGGIRAYAQGYFFGPSLNNSVVATTHADSFDHNYAVALVAPEYHNIQPDGSFYAINRRMGKFDGPGILTGWFKWNVGTGSSLTLPHSGIFQAQAAPEPSSWAMFFMSFSAIGWLIRRGKRQKSIAI